MEEAYVDKKKVWLQIEAHILDENQTIKLTSGVSVPVDINVNHIEVLNNLLKDIRGFIKQTQENIRKELNEDGILGI